MKLTDKMAKMEDSLSLLEKQLEKMTEALQVMYEGCLGAVQGIAQALDAFQLKTQEGHAQALDALETMKKTQAEHTAHLLTVERRFRQIVLRIGSFG